jgi:capsid assembly protease
MLSDYPHLSAEVYNTPWMIDPSKFAEIEAAFLNRVNLGVGANLPTAARPSKREVREVKGDVAIINVSGTLTPRPSLMTSGGTSCREVSEALSEYVADSDIGAIVLRFNSPGGQTSGIQELGEQIVESKRIKPCHGVAEHSALSAAYWLLSQCTSVSAAPNSMIGSIGVIWSHTNMVKSLEMQGKSTTLVTSGRRKAGGSPELPLDEETRKHMEQMCESLHEKFISAVASGRNVSKDTVRSAAWGEGAQLLADDAIKCGMVDRIATCQNIVDMLRGQSSAHSKRKLATRKSESM